MASAMELKILRRNMEQYIQADPIVIALERGTWAKTTSGGYQKTNSTTLDPQTFRLTPFKRRVTNYTAQTQDGSIQVADFLLIGRYSADINRGDSFELNGVEYVVWAVETKSALRNSDRIIAEVVGRDRWLAYQVSS